MEKSDLQVDCTKLNESLPEVDTPILMDVISSSNVEFIEFLVELGADVNTISYEGNFPLAVASCLGCRDIFEYLQPLTKKELRNRREGKWHLRKSIKALKRRNRLVIEELLLAAKINNILKLKAAILLDVDINSVNPITGKVAIHEACKKGNIDAIEVLLNAGANINLKLRGETPFSVAKQLNQTEAVKLLEQWSSKI